jgi:hypothetical protein
MYQRTQIKIGRNKHVLQTFKEVAEFLSVESVYDLKRGQSITTTNGSAYRIYDLAVNITAGRGCIKYYVELE